MDKITVVLADDSRQYMDLFKDDLERDGTIRVVAAAEDGEEALEAVKREEPDFLICDVLLKKLDGLELIRRLGEENLPRKGCVIISAFSSVASAAEATRLGVDLYLLKPADPELLSERIRSLSFKEETGDGIFAPSRGTAEPT